MEKQRNVQDVSLVGAQSQVKGWEKGLKMIEFQGRGFHCLT